MKGTKRLVKYRCLNLDWLAYTSKSAPYHDLLKFQNLKPFTPPLPLKFKLEIKILLSLPLSLFLSLSLFLYNPKTNPRSKQITLKFIWNHKISIIKNHKMNRTSRAEVNREEETILRRTLDHSESGSSNKATKRKTSQGNRTQFSSRSWRQRTYLT